MPRVKVAAPSPASIKSHPREFALLQQLKVDNDGVESETLAEYQKLYGDSSKTAAGESMSFEDFAGLFARPALEVEGDGNCIAYAARDKTGLAPFRLNRREVRADDVRIQITHAGVCHSDVHQVHGDWGNSKYPMVPGHEIGGIVTEVGPQVTKFKVGDRVGVGCMVNSCQDCHWCNERHEEQFCEKKYVNTYNDKDYDGTVTHGGYSTFVVVRDRFVLRMPENLPLGAATPLLCAGITVYSPLKHFGLDKPGMKIGVVGLGGLGHMAVKFATAMGCEVTVISTSPTKEQEAKEVLGAQHFLVSKDEEAMKAATNSLDGIINTVSAKHPLTPLLMLLKTEGKMVCVGAPPVPSEVPTMVLLMKRLTLAGSLIGGVKETQEMLDFASEKNITCMIETCPIDYINTAYDRMIKSDVRYRFVIDIQGSLVQ